MLDNAKVMSLLGSKYYRYLDINNESSLEIIRVIGIQNIMSVKVKYEDGNIAKLDPEFVLKNYKRLKSDGMIVAATVSCDAGNGTLMDDVMVCLYKMEDIGTQPEPYAVCRQNINDIFYEYLNPNPTAIYAGCCISADSVPAHMKFKNVLQCNKINYALSINVYMDDLLEDILEMIKSAKFDKVLKNSYDAYLKEYCNDPFIERVSQLDGKSIHGWCSSLKSLLVENNFMYDFNTCFSITPLDFTIKVVNDNGTDRLGIEQMIILKDILRENIKTTFVVGYDKTIEFDKIKSKYLIAKDNTGNMYVIGYLTEGEYVFVNKDAKEVSEQLRAAAGLSYTAEKYNK